MERVGRMIGEVADAVLKHVSDRMPGLEAFTLEILDTIFAPRLVLRHLMVAVALQTGLLTYNGLVVVANRLLSRLSTRHGEAKAYRHKMRTAKNYEEWRMYAERVDHLEGHDEWRKRPDSLLYNHKVLQQQISDLNAMINAEDVFGLMFRLRCSLSRNQHGMLHEGLFSRAHAGTKVLVERYHEVVCEALHYVCAKNAVAQDIPTDAKLAFFNETRHAYGRTALMLSGGAAMGVYHAGVVKALLERKLLPRVVSGASAGSIVAAMVGTRTDAELRPMFDGKGVNLEFFQPLRRSFKKTSGDDDKYKNSAFWQLLVPPGLRWMGTRLWNVLLHSEGFLSMDTDYFKNVLRHNIGPSTFQEAFDRTGRIVNITVAPQNKTDPPRLLNYLTAPHVLVWSAAVCSSSVPGVFEPSVLLVKDADGSTHPESGPIDKFVDGSMEADLPMQQISELFNINHFIVSQVNPHASLLSTMALSKSVWSSPTYSFLVGIVGFLQTQVRNWFRNVIEFVSHRRLAPVWASKRGGIQLLTQEYEGRHCDVTITPWKGEENVLSSFAKMLKNVNTEEFHVMTIVAERNTWPKVEMIRSHCAVEMSLEQCVQTLRRQLTAENQVRMLAASQHPSSEQLRREGRVSSFYTSRSLVNLSGLSVTDPSIVMEQQPHQYPSSSTLAAIGNDSAILEEKDGDDGDVGLNYLEGPLLDERQDEPNRSNGNLHGPGLGGGLLTPNGGTGGGTSLPHRGAEWRNQPEGGRREHEEGAANGLGIYSTLGGAELSPPPGRATAGADDDAAAAVWARQDERRDSGTDLGWLSLEQLAEMGLASREDVVKSTSMANFYYRRSKSLEASMNEMSQVLHRNESSNQTSCKVWVHLSFVARVCVSLDRH
ncbi:conserved unknown protein [Ectocarpus siliculosus]|uniref:PNPLA domain-containing protein n=1 Tax=Ectocarpus siliculosus TaxID=2880 RepID=D8LSB8_ECTSI|nr:conserved unknown protein [Ectocarpus siliculosus]|eukprot:CBN75175.1 conserved unknown protein [Ectocarpus siliculosus]